MIITDEVLICDELIVVVGVINQEEELLIMLGWQWLDVLFQQVQVLNGLVNDFLL